MGVRNMLVNWLNQNKTSPSAYGADMAIGHDFCIQGDIKLSIRPASNGRLLVAQVYRPISGPGSDWENSLHLVPDGTSLVEAIARVLVLQKVS
jgi:hypothetical protein